MSTNDAPVDGSQWFGVRCVHHDVDANLFEERITLWRAASFDEAIELAENEAAEYARAVGGHALEFAQAFQIEGDPRESGAEVFSLMRESSLDPASYIDRFFDTSAERQRHQ